MSIAALAAIYLWFKPPHKALGAVLMLASIGVADLVSVRFIKPAISYCRDVFNCW